MRKIVTTKKRYKKTAQVAFKKEHFSDLELLIRDKNDKRILIAHTKT